MDEGGDVNGKASQSVLQAFLNSAAGPVQFLKIVKWMVKEDNEDPTKLLSFVADKYPGQKSLPVFRWLID